MADAAPLRSDAPRSITQLVQRMDDLNALVQRKLLRAEDIADEVQALGNEARAWHLRTARVDAPLDDDETTALPPMPSPPVLLPPLVPLVPTAGSLAPAATLEAAPLPNAHDDSLAGYPPRSVACLKILAARQKCTLENVPGNGSCFLHAVHETDCPLETISDQRRVTSEEIRKLDLEAFRAEDGFSTQDVRDREASDILTPSKFYDDYSIQGWCNATGRSVRIFSSGCDPFDAIEENQSVLKTSGGQLGEGGPRLVGLIGQIHYVRFKFDPALDNEDLRMETVSSLENDYNALCLLTENENDGFPLKMPPTPDDDDPSRENKLYGLQLYSLLKNYWRYVPHTIGDPGCEADCIFKTIFDPIYDESLGDSYEVSTPILLDYVIMKAAAGELKIRKLTNVMSVAEMYLDNKVQADDNKALEALRDSRHTVSYLSTSCEVIGREDWEGWVHLLSDDWLTNWRTVCGTHQNHIVVRKLVELFIADVSEYAVMLRYRLDDPQLIHFILRATQAGKTNMQIRFIWMAAICFGHAGYFLLRSGQNAMADYYKFQTNITAFNDEIKALIRTRFPSEVLSEGFEYGSYMLNACHLWDGRYLYNSEKGRNALTNKWPLSYSRLSTPSNIQRAFMQQGEGYTMAKAYGVGKDGFFNFSLSIDESQLFSREGAKYERLECDTYDALGELLIDLHKEKFPNGVPNISLSERPDEPLFKPIEQVLEERGGATLSALFRTHTRVTATPFSNILHVLRHLETSDSDRQPVFCEAAVKGGYFGFEGALGLAADHTIKTEWVEVNEDQQLALEEQYKDVIGQYTEQLQPSLEKCLRLTHCALGALKDEIERDGFSHTLINVGTPNKGLVRLARFLVAEVANRHFPGKVVVAFTAFCYTSVGEFVGGPCAIFSREAAKLLDNYLEAASDCFCDASLALRQGSPDPVRLAQTRSYIFADRALGPEMLKIKAPKIYDQDGMRLIQFKRGPDLSKLLRILHHACTNAKLDKKSLNVITCGNGQLDMGMTPKTFGGDGHDLGGHQMGATLQLVLGTDLVMKRQDAETSIQKFGRLTGGRENDEYFKASGLTVPRCIIPNAAKVAFLTGLDFTQQITRDAIAFDKDTEVSNSVRIMFHKYKGLSGMTDAVQALLLHKKANHNGVVDLIWRLLQNSDENEPAREYLKDPGAKALSNEQKVRRLLVTEMRGARYQLVVRHFARQWFKWSEGVEPGQPNGPSDIIFKYKNATDIFGHLGSANFISHLFQGADDHGYMPIPLFVWHPDDPENDESSRFTLSDIFQSVKEQYNLSYVKIVSEESDNVQLESWKAQQNQKQLSKQSTVKKPPSRPARQREITDVFKFTYDDQPTMLRFSDFLDVTKQTLQQNVGSSGWPTVEEIEKAETAPFDDNGNLLIWKWTVSDHRGLFGKMAAQCLPESITMSETHRNRFKIDFLCWYSNRNMAPASSDHEHGHEACTRKRKLLDTDPEE